LFFLHFFCIFYQSNTAGFFALKTFTLCQYHHVLRCGTQSPSTDIFFCTSGSPLPFPGVASRSPLSTPIQTQMIHGARHPTQHRMPCEVDRPSHWRGGGVAGRRVCLAPVTSGQQCFGTVQCSDTTTTCSSFGSLCPELRKWRERDRVASGQESGCFLPNSKLRLRLQDGNSGNFKICGGVPCNSRVVGAITSD